MKEGEQTKHTKEIFTLFSWDSLLEPLKKEDSLKTKEIKMWRIRGAANISAAGRHKK